MFGSTYYKHRHEMDVSCQINAISFYPPSKLAPYPWKMTQGGSLNRSRRSRQVLNHFVESNQYSSVRHGVISKSTHGVPGSVVGIATGNGLGGTGIESQWGARFPHLSRPALGPTQPPVQWVPAFSRGKERPGREADPSSPSSAVVMKG